MCPPLSCYHPPVNKGGQGGERLEPRSLTPRYLQSPLGLITPHHSRPYREHAARQVWRTTVDSRGWWELTGEGAP